MTFFIVVIFYNRFLFYVNIRWRLGLEKIFVRSCFHFLGKCWKAMSDTTPPSNISSTAFADALARARQVPKYFHLNVIQILESQGLI